MTSALARSASAPGQHVYDVIVFGSQLAGLFTACTLAKRGRGVLYVRHEVAPKGTDVPSPPLLLPAPKSIAAFETLLQDLGLVAALQRVTHPVTVQLLRPGQWFELAPAGPARTAELKRALGADAPALERELAAMASAADATDSTVTPALDLPPEGFFGRWKFRRRVARLPALSAEAPVRDAMLQHLAGFLTGVEVPSALTLSRTLGKALASPHVVTGGREGLWRLFHARAKELGVDVIDGATVESVTFEGRTPVGVRLAHGDTVYRAPFVVVGTDAEALVHLVPAARRKPLAGLTALLDANTSVFTLDVTLPEHALPPGLGEVALVASPDAELGHLVLQVIRSEGQSDRRLSISARVPTALGAGGGPAISALVDRIWAVLDPLFPFTRGHQKTSMSNWADAPSQTLPLLSLPADAPLGVSALTVASPFSRLLWANRQVLPGLGVEGDALTALRVAQRIDTALQKSPRLSARSAAS